MPFNNFFSRRWNGQVPLAVLLWHDMIYVGTVINLLTVVLTLTAIIQDAYLGLVIALHFAAMPYNFFLFAALWRAPDRNPFATAVAIGWFLIMTLI